MQKMLIIKKSSSKSYVKFVYITMLINIYNFSTHLFGINITNFFEWQAIRRDASLLTQNLINEAS